MDEKTSREVAEISVAVVNEIFDVVQKEARDKKSDEFGDALSLSIIRNIIFVLVYNSVVNIEVPSNMSDEKIEELTKLSYATMKDNLQNAIADGFEAASEKYSGVSMGYYCKIIPAGPPVNTMAI
jgi:hypothetical protein